MGDVENRRAAPSDYVDERVDGPEVVRISDDDPAAPFYRLLTKLRAPVAMRDMMMAPVRAATEARGWRSTRPNCRRAPRSSIRAES